MPNLDFPAALRDAGLSQAGFRRLVNNLTGYGLHPNTTSRWMHGERGAGNPATLALAIAVLRLYRQKTEKTKTESEGA